jgi:hypothetical protein
MSTYVNSLTAAELKRRGMAAIEDGLRHGPVHLVKRNKASAVVLSADDYARLSQPKPRRPTGITATQWLLNQPSGNKRKTQLDKSLRAERDRWS